MYKLAISNIAWDETEAAEMYTILQRCGLAVEIAPPKVFEGYPNYKIMQVQQFKQHLNETYGIPIISLQSILFGLSAELFKSKEEYMLIKTQIQSAICCAQLLDCPNIVFGSPKNRNTYCEEDKQKGIDFFREIGQFAKQHNTVLAIEANPRIYGTNYINTTREAFELATVVDCDGFRVNVDFGTMIENDESLDILVENATYINHIHVSEPYLEAIKTRDLHKELAIILNKIGYEKYISIEMKKQDLTTILKSIEYIKEVFHGV